MIVTAFSLYHDRFGGIHAYQTRVGIRRAIFSEKPQKAKNKQTNKHTLVLAPFSLMRMLGLKYYNH